MNILINNIFNLKTNLNQTKNVQNPITFKGIEPQGDVLELSEYKKQEKLSPTSKSDFEDIEAKYQVHKNAESNRKQEIYNLAEELTLLHDNLNFEPEDFETLYYNSMAPIYFFDLRPDIKRNFEQFYIKCTGKNPTRQANRKIFQCFNACNWSLSPHKTLEENTKLIKLALKSSVDSLQEEAKNLSVKKDFKFDEKQYSQETFINIYNLDNFKSDSPMLLKKFLDKIKIDNEEYIVNSRKNKEFLAQFENRIVYTAENFDKLGIPVEGMEQIFPECSITTLDEPLSTKRNGRKKEPASLISFPKGHPIGRIMQDIEEQKIVCSFSKNYYRNLPFNYTKYSPENESKPYDYIFIDKEDPENKKLINLKAPILKRITALPFRYITKSGITFIDTKDEFNKALMQRDFVDPTPVRSEYFCSGGYKEKDIPVEYLEKLGFGKAEDLIKLIENKKLEGKVSPDKKSAVVTIDGNRDMPLFGECNTTILRDLRDANPKVKSLKEMANALKITQKSLEYAIIDGDVEIIPEYIFVFDNETKYIDISTQKNQEFIRKIKFERELEKSLREAERQELQQAKIANQDLRQRINGIRQSLVWEFMPNTRIIGSELAKKDGYLCKLLKKEAEDKDSLTKEEEAKINAYRKELWTIAGNEELKQAHQKANQIMKVFKEYGLASVDAEFLPIFAKYGFE